MDTGRQLSRDIDATKMNKAAKRWRKCKQDKESVRDTRGETERALSVYCRRHKR